MTRDCIKKPLGPSELKLQLTINIDKTVADLKQAIAEKSDVEADRQRLIYSGQPFSPFPSL
jgi:ubiquilin